MARGRSAFELPYTCDKEKARDITIEFMQSHGFKAVTEGTETVWKKGSGLFSAMQYVRTDIMATKIVAQAWVRMAFFSASTLDGFIAGAPKRRLKKTINQLAETLRNA